MFYALTISLLLFSIPAFSKSAHPTSMVIQPRRGGLSDEAGLKTADLLRQKLKENRSLYVVDPEKVDAVLNYYAGYSFSSSAPALEEAGSLLSSAKEHYFQLACGEAAAELKKLELIFKQNPELVFSDGQILFDALIVKALALSALKKREEAVQAFEEAIRLDPLQALPEKSFSPSILRLYREAKEKVQKQSPFSTLHIAGNPKVADIYLNGIYQGVSPLSFSLPAGEYALSFRANNYRRMDQHVALKEGEAFHIRHDLLWTGPAQKTSSDPAIETAKSQIEEGLRIAELLKVDKVLLVEADEEKIAARLIDRKYRAGHRPISLALNRPPEKLEEDLEKLVRFIFAQTQLDLLKNPQAHLDPDGVGDPILLGRRRRTIPKTFLWGGLGAAGVGGILAALLSGGSSSPNTGGVAVSFK